MNTIVDDLYFYKLNKLYERIKKEGASVYSSEQYTEDILCWYFVSGIKNQKKFKNLITKIDQELHRQTSSSIIR